MTTGYIGQRNWSTRLVSERFRSRRNMKTYPTVRRGASGKECDWPVKRIPENVILADIIDGQRFCTTNHLEVVGKMHKLEEITIDSGREDGLHDSLQ